MADAPRPVVRAPPRGPGGGAVAIALTVATLLLVSSNAFAMPASAPATTKLTKLQLFTSNIKHIVFLMMENHAYDNFYGGYCQALGPYCAHVGNGIPAGTCVPYYPGQPGRGCHKPYNFTLAQTTIPDIAHNWHSTHQAINGGKMNGFWAAEGSNNETFGVYNGTTVPVEWDLAEQYGLSDNFYSSAASYSLPNHWYEIAASAPFLSYNFTFGHPGVNATTDFQYLNESNATPTITDELVNSTVSWRYYDFPLTNYTNSTQPVPTSNAFNYWIPAAARHQSYSAIQKPHFVARSAFYTDAANGKLPAVSWVIPAVADAEHPSTNLTAGETFEASVVDALEKSPQWNSTVLYITWDEYGGFYDHVAPPVLDGNGAGIRVPLLTIGPWVAQGYIDSTPTSFDSVLHLIEKRFGLPCIGQRDCNAKLPLQMFVFGRGPRAPIYIPDFANASYPMPLQSSGKLPYYGPNQGPAVPTAPGSTRTAMTPVAGVDWN